MKGLLGRSAAGAAEPDARAAVGAAAALAEALLRQRQGIHLGWPMSWRFTAIF